MSTKVFPLGDLYVTTGEPAEMIMDDEELVIMFRYEGRNRVTMLSTRRYLELLEESSELDELATRVAPREFSESGEVEDARNDRLIGQAMDLVTRTGVATTSLIQKHMNLGYSKALYLLKKLERMGVVDKERKGKAREVFYERRQERGGLILPPLE